MTEQEDQHQLVKEAVEIADHEAHPGRAAFASTIRSWAVLVASLAALVTALGAWFRPQDHSVTQTSYEEVGKSIEKISVEESANHDDIVALRQFLADQGKAVTVPIPLANTGAPSRPDAAAPLSSVAAPTATTSVIHVEFTNPPPTIHTFAKPEPPPSFSKILTDSKMQK